MGLTWRWAVALVPALMAMGVRAAAKVSGKHAGCRAEGKVLVIRVLEGEGLAVR